MKKINKIFLLTIVTFVFFTIFPISTSAWRKYVNDSTIPVTCKYKKYFYQSTGNTLENDNGNYNIYSITFEMKLLYGAKPYRAGTSNLEKAYPLEKQGNKYIINMTEKKGDFGPGVIENPHLSTDFVVEGGYMLTTENTNIRMFNKDLTVTRYEGTDRKWWDFCKNSGPYDACSGRPFSTYYNQLTSSQSSVLCPPYVAVSFGEDLVYAAPTMGISMPNVKNLVVYNTGNNINNFNEPREYKWKSKKQKDIDGISEVLPLVEAFNEKVVHSVAAARSEVSDLAALYNKILNIKNCETNPKEGNKNLTAIKTKLKNLELRGFEEVIKSLRNEKLLIGYDMTDGWMTDITSPEVQLQYNIKVYDTLKSIAVDAGDVCSLQKGLISSKNIESIEETRNNDWTIKYNDFKNRISTIDVCTSDGALKSNVMEEYNIALNSIKALEIKAKELHQYWLGKYLDSNREDTFAEKYKNQFNEMKEDYKAERESFVATKNEAELKCKNGQSAAAKETLINGIEDANRELNQIFDESKEQIVTFNQVNIKDSIGSPQGIECKDFGDGFLMKIFGYITFAGVILLIVFGVIDFSKATLSYEEDAIGKAGKDFAKRVIAAILLFLLPTIVGLILEISQDVLDIDFIKTDCVVKNK